MTTPLTPQRGDTLRLKLNGEPVVFLKEDGDEYAVRRAVSGTDGLRYSTHFFYPEELESVNDSINREFAEMIYKQKLMADHMKAQDAQEAVATPIDVSGRIQ